MTKTFRLLFHTANPVFGLSDTVQGPHRGLLWLPVPLGEEAFLPETRLEVSRKKMEDVLCHV